MKNTMKLNALGILVALTVAGQAEAGVGSWFGRGPKAPQLPKVTITPKAEAPSNSGKAEWVMAGLSAFGGQIASGAKALATKTVSGYKATKAATVAASKTGAAKFAALPVKAKAGIALAAGSVLAYGAHKLYKHMTAPVYTCDTEKVAAKKAQEAADKAAAKAKKEANAKLGYVARAQAQAVAAKDAVVNGLKKPFARANVQATKDQVAADAKMAADLAAAEAKKAQEARDAKIAAELAAKEAKLNAANRAKSLEAQIDTLRKQYVAQGKHSPKEQNTAEMLQLHAQYESARQAAQ